MHERHRQDFEKDVLETWLLESMFFQDVSDHIKISDIRCFRSEKHNIRMYQLPVSEIMVVAVANWGAPSLVSSEHLTSQANILGSLVNCHSEKGSALGLLISPSHAYKRGHLWKSEEAAHKILANARCSCDVPFVIPFQARHDERDQRTLVPVRITAGF